MDPPMLGRYGDILEAGKLAEFPMPLPLLLITSKQDACGTVRQHFPFVDELICTPISVTHLQERVESLMRQRRLAKELRARKNESLKRSRSNLDLAVRAAKVGLFEWQPGLGKIVFSPEWKRQIGYQDEEFADDVGEWRQRIHPDDLEQVFGPALRVSAGQISDYSARYRLLHRDGSYRWIETLVSRVEHEDEDHPLRLIGVHLDITERHRDEQRLRIAATAFESNDAMIVTDLNFRILEVNAAFTKATGYAPEEAVGATPRMLRSALHGPAFYQQMLRALREKRYWSGEVWNKRKNGKIYPARISISAVLDVEGRVSHYVANSVDITEEKNAEERIHFYAFNDPLTELPNRRSFEQHCLRRFQAVRSEPCALLLIDLDQFKLINDARGHHFGDALLIEIAQRLALSLPPGAFLARFSGDEFVALLHGFGNSPSKLMEIAEAIRLDIKRPFFQWGHQYFPAASLGVYIAADCNTSSQDLLKRANIALHQAKETGRDRVALFDPVMETAALHRASMETDLHRALDQRELRVFYQLQVDAEGDALGAEVLLRWQHPERGMVSPGEFIPIAEETGLIVPMGEWVMRNACAQLKHWQAHEATRHMSLSVNVSARQFDKPDFVDQVKQVLSETGVDPTKLKLEITESSLIDGLAGAVHKMGALRALGVNFSLDDFGTGYSSLSYLKNLPLNQLKIDQSFVQNLPDSAQDAMIVRTIIAMAHNLGFEVIAEGVETLEQRAFLGNHGCLAYQGYFFGRPEPLEAFERALGLDPASAA
jgi:diguanylate cyclase (GGDEF)-like protein/PAS domain S-box-containing protein